MNPPRRVDRLHTDEIEVGAVYRGGMRGLRRQVLRSDGFWLRVKYLDQCARTAPGREVRLAKHAFCGWVNVWRRLEELYR